MPMILASGRIGAADGASSSRSPLALFDSDRWVPAQARRENVPAGEMSRRELGRRTAEGMRSRVSRISPLSSLPYDSPQSAAGRGRERAGRSCFFERPLADQCSVFRLVDGERR